MVQDESRRGSFDRRSWKGFPLWRSDNPVMWSVRHPQRILRSRATPTLSSVRGISPSNAVTSLSFSIAFSAVPAGQPNQNGRRVRVLIITPLPKQKQANPASQVYRIRSCVARAGQCCDISRERSETKTVINLRDRLEKTPTEWPR